MVNSLSFLMSENVFIFAFIPEESFHGIHNSGLRVLFFENFSDTVPLSSGLSGS